MTRIVNVDFIIKYTLFSVCTFLSFFVKAQTLDNNLISNPSLDEIELCTDNQWHIANGTQLIDWWFWGGGAGYGSASTYFNTCHEELMNGIQSLNSSFDTRFTPIQPRTGEGYCFFLF